MSRWPWPWPWPWLSDRDFHFHLHSHLKSNFGKLSSQSDGPTGRDWWSSLSLSLSRSRSRDIYSSNASWLEQICPCHCHSLVCKLSSQSETDDLYSHYHCLYRPTSDLSDPSVSEVQGHFQGTFWRQSSPYYCDVPPWRFYAFYAFYAMGLFSAIGGPRCDRHKSGETNYRTQCSKEHETLLFSAIKFSILVCEFEARFRGSYFYALRLSR